MFYLEIQYTTGLTLLNLPAQLKNLYSQINLKSIHTSPLCHPLPHPQIFFKWTYFCATCRIFRHFEAKIVFERAVEIGVPK